MENWYKTAKKRKKKKNKGRKKPISPYVIDDDGVMKYRTPNGLMIAEDEESEEKRAKIKRRDKKDKKEKKPFKR